MGKERNMRSCVLCRNRFEAADPAVLFISKYGTPRVLCADCEALLDRATDGEGDALDRDDARERVLVLAGAIHDAEVLHALRDVLEGETGPTETEEDIDAAARWEETRADESEEDAEAEEAEVAGGIVGYLPLIIAGALFVAFLLWWFLR